MSKPIAVLMEEHRLIEQVLGSLESYAVAVEGGLAVERSREREGPYAQTLIQDRESGIHDVLEPLIRVDIQVVRGFHEVDERCRRLLHDSKLGSR